MYCIFISSSLNVYMYLDYDIHNTLYIILNNIITIYRFNQNQNKLRNCSFAVDIIFFFNIDSFILI
jgi:hypothetical protein